MGNTYRRNKRTGMRERDGYRAAISVICEHNNWCPWCRGNRTFRNQWLDEKEEDERKRVDEPELRLIDL